MAVKKYVVLDNLREFKAKADELYVKRELKTDSEDEYKVLSDNNLTDELLAKVEAVTKSGFDGTYGSLTGKPAIDGTELSSASTAAGLGLAKKADIPGIATAEAAGIVKPDGTTITVDESGIIKVSELDSYLKKETADSTYAKTTDLPKAATDDAAGLVKPDGTTTKVTEDGTISAVLDGYMKSADLKVATKESAGIVKIGDGITLSEDGTGTISVALPEGSDDILTKTEAGSTYLTKEDAKSGYASKTDIEDMATNSGVDVKLQGYAKSSQVTQDISDAKDEINESIKAQIASTYKAKGSKATVTELPDPTAETVGDVYNMSAGFTTDDKFEEESKYYPKGTNVVVADMGEETYKYDVLSGDYDLSIYQKSEELQEVTNAEVDALFAAA